MAQGLTPLKYTKNWNKDTNTREENWDEIANKTASFATQTLNNLKQLGLDLGGADYQFNGVGRSTQSTNVISRLDTLESQSALVFTQNIGLDLSDTTKIRIVGSNGSELTATNKGLIGFNSSADPGEIVIRELTAAQEITLTGAHWGLGTGGDVTDYPLSLVFFDDGVTAILGVTATAGRSSIANTDVFTVSTSVVAVEDVLAAATVSSTYNVTYWGWIKGDFDDTGNPGGEDYWTLQSGVGDVNIGVMPTDFGVNQTVNGLWKFSKLTEFNSTVLMKKGASGGAAYNPQSVTKIENSQEAYLEFSTPATNQAGIIFSDGTSGVGQFIYDHNVDRFSFNQPTNISGTNKLSLGNNANTSFRESSAGVLVGEVGGTDLLTITNASHNMTFSKSVDANVSSTIQNSSNTSSAQALQHILSGGSSAADAYTTWGINGTRAYALGIDNSDSDKLKLNTVSGNGSTSPSTDTNLWEILTNGELLMPNVDPPTANYHGRSSGIDAWLYYVDGSGSVTNSFNIDSVTSDNGDGLYVINWDTNFATTFGYAVTGGCVDSGFFACQLGGTGSSITIAIYDSATDTTTDGDFNVMATGPQ